LNSFLVTLIIAGMFVSTSPAQVAPASLPGQLPAYLDTSFTFRERAADLVSRMTLEEKISQMQTNSAAIPHLGIPVYKWWNECLHGVADNGIATVFPQAIGMAATWDPQLIHTEADIISTEARAKYNDAVSKGENGRHQGITFFSPNINIFRDPRWGRGQETYGEDPYLTSRMGVAFVTGLQGNDQKYFKVTSTPKHFAVHSGPESGRHSFDARVSKTDLYDTYFPAFEACVKDGKAFSVMGAYSALDGIPDCANKFLLTDVLRTAWGFEGYVVSDCGAIGDIYRGHRFAPDLAAASALAVKAGCDLSCGREGYASLNEAVQRGLITEAEIDTAVTRLMLARFKLGMFDPASEVPFSKLTISDNDTPEQRSVAKKVADESIVLLKNAGHMLPLKKGLRSIAVIGAYADNVNVLLGNYHGTPSNPVTLLQGIKNKVQRTTKIYFAPGYNLLEERIVTPEIIRSAFTRISAQSEIRGLHAEYFSNPQLKGKPPLVRTDTLIDQRWDTESPGKDIPLHDFSVRWTGAITPAATGSYNLGVFTDQKDRLYFNGKLLLDNWRESGKNIATSRVVKMEKGKIYKIEIDYASDSTTARIRFWWQKFEEVRPERSLLQEAIAAAKKSDVVIAVAGISALLESEENNRIDLPGFKGGDRTDLVLPAEQEEMLNALYKTHKPIVLVLVGGSALAVNWEEEHLPAIMDAWYPGEEGGDAVAGVLFGEYNPAGRLPITFYRSIKDLPLFTEYSMKGRTYRFFEGKPLYPFGYGLSYTSFRYTDISMTKGTVNSEDTIKLSFKVQNAGKQRGDEVVQLYVKGPASSQSEPIKSLKDFRRVSIDVGVSIVVKFSVPVQSLKQYSEKKGASVVEPGDYEMEIGSSSKDIRLRCSIAVK